MEENKNLCKAMAEAFPEIEGAVRDKAAHKYKYADLSNVIAAIKPALASRGLWFVQNIHNNPGFASVETIIMHSSGESLSCGTLSIPVPREDAQGYGSALTYARRYSLTAAFGVAQEDDDGKAACLKDRNEDRKIDKEFASQEVRKLEDPELKKLASKVANTLMDDHSLNCPISDLEMAEYLAFWQTKKPLQPTIDNLLVSDRAGILNGFMMWQAKQAA
jgi:hypothetical protein